MQNAHATQRNGAIDGLRVLSIAAIVMYHLNLPWIPSGHMGVVIFLVLSGYLATSSIVRAYDRNGKPRVSELFRAWGRRLLRIWPSVIALVAIAGTLCGTLNHVLLTKMRPDVLPSLGFYLNWSYIFNNVSYFDLIGGTSPLLHLWYLGCDMQFFFAWTLVVTILLAIGKPFARRVAFLLACASAAWMAWLYVPGADPSRIYYGTDTRAFALLLGSWLALWFPLGGTPLAAKRLFVKELDVGWHDPHRIRATVWSHLLGLASFAGIVAAMILIPADSDLWYRGGMFAFSLLVTILLATLLAPRTLIGLIIGLAPFRVLGLRSFALYLWHYPIFLLMDANKTTTEWWMRLAAVGVSLVAAELSLRLVERPFGHLPHRQKKIEGEEQAPEEMRPRRFSRLGKVVPVVSAIGIIACGAYTYHALDITPPEFLVPQEAIVSTGSSAGEAMDVSSLRPMDNQTQPGQEQADDQSDGLVEGEDLTEETEQVEEEPQAPAEPVEVTERTIVGAASSEIEAGLFDPLLIGDSVPGDAGDEFVNGGLGWQTRLPNALIDTFIGRSPSQSLDVLRGYLDQNVVGHVIVMACFSNSTPYPETLDAMIEAAGPDREIYLVGTVNPDGFQDAANTNLMAAADAHENVHYVDWPAVLEGHMDEYLWADATHLRPAGAGVYVDMIVRAIAQDLVDVGGTTWEA